MADEGAVIVDGDELHNRVATVAQRAHEGRFAAGLACCSEGGEGVVNDDVDGRVVGADDVADDHGVSLRRGA